MSDERKPLEMTDDQKDALTEVLRVAMGIEWEEQCTAMDGVLVLWPLIRDYVLEEAAKACGDIADRSHQLDRHDPETFSNGAGMCEGAIRAMKGKP